MRTNLEQFILINLSINAVTLAPLVRGRGQMRWGRFLFAISFGTLYALAMQWEPFWQLRLWPCRLSLPLLMTLVAVPVDSYWELFLSSALLILESALLAGLFRLGMELTGNDRAASLIVAGLVGGAGLFLLMAERGRRLEQWEARILLRRGDRTASFRALIDTGNRLHEPISALPVLIVSQARLAALLPAALNAENPTESLPPGFRLVSYGALGGGGRMACFRPDELLVSFGKDWVRAPDLWIAVYPGKIPGGAKALAPPVIGRIGPAGAAPFRKIKSEGRENLWSTRRSRL